MIVVTSIMREPGLRRENRLVEKDLSKTLTYLDIAFIVGCDVFQEIINARDFGVESCWSGIGGFVGIFVGYSILQLPDFLYFVLQWLIRALNQPFDGRK